MKKVIILTQEVCPSCNSLKMFNMAALKNEYDEHIEWLQLEDNEPAWRKLAAKASVSSTPTLIMLENDEIKEVINGFNAAATMKLFKENF